jgi:Fe-S-cluster-containing hydrogenase component 2
MEACPTHALICVDRNKLEQMNIENAAARRWPGKPAQ